MNNKSIKWSHLLELISSQQETVVYTKHWDAELQHHITYELFIIDTMIRRKDGKIEVFGEEIGKEIFSEEYFLWENGKLLLTISIANARGLFLKPKDRKALQATIEKVISNIDNGSIAHEQAWEQVEYLFKDSKLPFTKMQFLRFFNIKLTRRGELMFGPQDTSVLTRFWNDELQDYIKSELFVINNVTKWQNGTLEVFGKEIGKEVFHESDFLWENGHLILKIKISNNKGFLPPRARRILRAAIQGVKEDIDASTVSLGQAWNHIQRAFGDRTIPFTRSQFLKLFTADLTRTVEQSIKLAGIDPKTISKKRIQSLVARYLASGKLSKPLEEFEINKHLYQTSPFTERFIAISKSEKDRRTNRLIKELDPNNIFNAIDDPSSDNELKKFKDFFLANLTDDRHQFSSLPIISKQDILKLSEKRWDSLKDLSDSKKRWMNFDNSDNVEELDQTSDSIIIDGQEITSVVTDVLFYSGAKDRYTFKPIFKSLLRGYIATWEIKNNCLRLHSFIGVDKNCRLVTAEEIRNILNSTLERRTFRINIKASKESNFIANSSIKEFALRTSNFYVLNIESGKITKSIEYHKNYVSSLRGSQNSLDWFNKFYEEFPKHTDFKLNSDVISLLNEINSAGYFSKLKLKRLFKKRFSFSLDMAQDYYASYLSALSSFFSKKNNNEFYYNQLQNNPYNHRNIDFRRARVKWHYPPYEVHRLEINLYEEREYRYKHYKEIRDSIPMDIKTHNITNVRNVILEEKDRIMAKIDECRCQYLNLGLQLNGHEFEAEMVKLFQRCNYHAEKTKGSDDKGIDIILTINEEQIPVQCKNHLKKMSPSSIRDFQGATSTGNFYKSIFISTNGYSKLALEQAHKTNMLLLDKHSIISINNKKGKEYEMLKEYLNS